MLGQRLLGIGSAALLATAAMVAVALVSETTPTTDSLIKRWSSGPVRYLMSNKEDEAVRGLRTVPELSRFISAFWARRDPTPGTIENQFRRTYWERVLEAERRFRDSTTPGWKTDRGKIFIMLGAPDDIQTDENPGFSAGLSKGIAAVETTGHQRGIQRWTYHRIQSRTADAEFIVAFVKDESLDWKLSTDPDLIQPTFPGTVTTDATDAQFGGIEARPSQQRAAATAGRGPSAQSTQTGQEAIESAFPIVDTSLFANYDLGLEVSVPSTAEEMIATVTARQFLTAFPATARFEFFRAADGSTFVNVGAIIKEADIYPPGAAGRGKSALRLYASVTPNAAGGRTRYAGNDARPAVVEPAKGPAPGGVYDVWTGLALRSGAYRVTMAIEDSLTGRIGRTAADLEVPDFSLPGLRLSTLVLASDLSDAGGRVGVTARSSAVFRKSETLGIYFEVYGLPGGDGARFKTVYRFYRETPEGASPSPIGKPIVLENRTGAAQGWSFPLAKWPAGRFRMEVSVTGPDSVSASGLVAFEVVG